MKVSASLALFLCCFLSYGQSLKCETYPLNLPIVLDSLPVEASSISVSPEMSYQLVDNATTLLFQTHESFDSVTVCFRKISSAIQTPIFYRDIAKYDAGSYSRETRSKQPQKASQDKSIFSFGNVNTYGAITRGVSFGNRQSVFVNSSLNLQMDGELTDDLRVSAVITDQNVPYQPEGNTQQIRDFDNVFIKLYNDKFSLTAGDIVLENPVQDGYFLQYKKNVQGLQLNNEWEKGDWKGRSQLSASLSKGQFTSTVINPLEGVQGPYKLRGAKGERFIIVLANTEKVYLDGQLLMRGFDQDYIIDYNLAEVTFSNTTVITRFSRIRIDYEYANQYYSRSNISASQSLEREHLEFYVNYYQEKDNPSSSIGFDLSDQDLQNLRSAGDAANGSAIISGIDSVGYLESAILYRQKDTLDIDGQSQIIFQYSNDPDLATFQLRFSLITEGSYILTRTTANGQIYEWVGSGNGDYEPIQVIPTPNQKRMIVVGTKAKLTEFEQISQETAFSRQDQNLYSNIDDDNNQGIAWKGGFESAGRSFKSLPNYELGLGITFEYNHEDFGFIDRFRAPDYDWTWNYNVFTDTLSSRRDMILNTNLFFRENQRNGVSYSFSWRNREGVIDGTQHSFEFNKKLGAFQFDSQSAFLNNQTNVFDATWLRSSQEIQLVDFIVRPGYEFSVDQNLTKAASKDSVLSTQMNFTQHNLFLESGDSSKVTYRFDYISRQDNLPIAGDMTPYTQAREYRFSFSANQFTSQKISGQLNYREVDELIEDEQTDRNIIGKLNWIGRFAKDHIISNLSFTTASVRELRRAFVFIPVPNGEGTHTWRDENNDGVQDINEFYESVNEDEKNFIKLFTPTDEYVEAFQTAYVHSLEVKAPQSWKGGNTIVSGLSRLSLMSNLRSQYKTTANSVGDRLTPFQGDLSKSELVSARSLYRSTIFYNRNAPGIGFDITRSDQGSKSLLSAGFQIKETEEWLGTYRFGVGTFLTFRGRLSTSTTDYSSDFLESRNFSINQRNLGGEVVLQPSNNFRVITSYTHRNKDVLDTELDEAGANVNEFKVESTWTKAGKGNLNAAFSWIDIQYEGATNTFLSYELLEAMQPGNNQRWNLNWQQSLGRGLQLTLQYFGRKSPDQDAAHTGSVQVTAFF